MKVAPYIAYKATKHDLKCRDTQFELDKIYSVPNPVEEPKLCTSDGFHYCDKLTDVFKYYSYNDNDIVINNNRFFEIEVLGYVNSPDSCNNDKRVTTSFRFVRELSKEEIKQALSVKKKEDHDKKMNINVLRKLQTEFPQVIIGGSLGLYLHGIELPRVMKNGVTEMDIIIPYYIKLSNAQELKSRSGNDFDFSIIFEGIKLDVKIDNKQKYDIIELDGFKYKVSLLEYILAAKINYALKGQEKHKNDIHRIVGKIR